MKTLLGDELKVMVSPENVLIFQKTDFEFKKSSFVRFVESKFTVISILEYTAFT